MLKLSDLIQVCRDVAHFCSEQASVFKQAFKQAGDGFVKTMDGLTKSITTAVTPDLRI
jgi:hypothetical protein